MKKIIEEFKKFAMRGNVIDLAVGVIIGAAFGKIVTSIVSDVIMPPVGLLIGGVNFTDLKLVLKGADVAANGDVIPAVTINYGNFLQTLFDFLIVAMVIFIVIRLINRLSSKKEKEEPAPAVPAPEPEDVVLLKEIRDLLKEKK